MEKGAEAKSAKKITNFVALPNINVSIMKAITIKKEMHQAIDVIDDTNFLKAIYVLLNEKTKEYGYELSEEEKQELDYLRKQHKSGKSKSYTLADVRKEALIRIKK